jgi:hypothetical protein
LEDGPPIFRQDFSCPALLFVSLVPHRSFHVRGYHPLWPPFPKRSVKSCAITNRLLRFRSPLLSESRLMSVPRATEMFQFTRFASHSYVFTMRYLLLGGFPHSEISGSKLICQLPEAYRRLSRPSSPIIAKASTTCSYSLDPITLTSCNAKSHQANVCQVFHLTRYAVQLISFDKIEYSLTQSKILVADGTVHTKPLRMCAFHQQR